MASGGMKTWRRLLNEDNAPTNRGARLKMVYEGRRAQLRAGKTPAAKYDRARKAWRSFRGWG